MTVYHAICVENYTLADAAGAVLELKRGQEYTIGNPNADGEVSVFTRYWAKVPMTLFAGHRDFDGKPVNIIEVPVPSQDGRAVGNMREAFLTGWREGWRAGRTHTVAAIMGAAPSAPPSPDQPLKDWVSYYEGDLRL